MNLRGGVGHGRMSGPVASPRHQPQPRLLQQPERPRQVLECVADQRVETIPGPEHELLGDHTELREPRLLDEREFRGLQPAEKRRPRVSDA